MKQTDVSQTPETRSLAYAISERNAAVVSPNAAKQAGVWLNGCTPIARTARTSGNEQECARMARANPSAPFVSGADISMHHWPERRHSRGGLIDDMDGGL